METRTFTLTEQHLKLLRHFYVAWWDAETGAPAIDPKRPYGNSAVLEDIHEILTGETHEELTDEEVKRYEAIHRETETALQIVLATAQFKTGRYECGKYGIKWKQVL